MENRNIQKVILDIFKVFKDICKKHNLTYFAIGGTCLGAIRHKGFIPWDDDMDVAMPYEDYKKFLKISEKELKYPYSLLCPQKNKHWINLFIKIHNVQTTFIEDFYKNYPDSHYGIWLDVMPIFGLPKEKIKRKFLCKLAILLLRQNKAYRYNLQEQNSLKEKILWLTTLPQKITQKPFYYFSNKIESKFSKFPFNSSSKILCCWRNFPLFFYSYRTNYQQILEYKDFSSTIEVPFEDTTIAIPIGYDNYLKMDFGDYMKLPPEEKRKPIHGDAIIDLENPYSFYQKN